MVIIINGYFIIYLLHKVDFNALKIGNLFINVFNIHIPIYSSPLFGTNVYYCL